MWGLGRVSTEKRKPPIQSANQQRMVSWAGVSCRMQNGIFLKGLKNNTKLFSCFICILRTMPFCILHSTKYPCVASLLHSRYSLKLRRVKRMKITAFIPTSFPDNNVFILQYCVTEQLINMPGLPVV